MIQIITCHGGEQYAESGIKVSVIIPVYNVERYLERAIQTLCAQTLKEMELIFVDDGSADGSGALIDAAVVRCGLCSAIHKKNGGLSDARNTGLVLARGEYIGFMDPDDEVAPDMFEKLYESAVKHHSDLVLCGYREIFSDTFIEERSIDLPEYGDDPSLPVSAFIKGRYGGYAWNKLYRRSTIEEHQIRFPVGIHLVEDNVFFCEYLKYVMRFSVVNQPLYFYIRRSDSLCARYHDRQFEYYRARYEAKKSLIQTQGVHSREYSQINDIDYLKTCLHMLDQMSGKENRAKLRERYLAMVRVLQNKEFLGLLSRYSDELRDKEDRYMAVKVKKRQYGRLFVHEYCKMRIVATFHYYFG